MTKPCFAIFFCFHVQEDMNLSESLREPIRNRDMATKLDMLCSFKRRQMASQVNQCYKQETVSMDLKNPCAVVECKWNASRR